MSDGYVQVSPDSSGKKIDSSELTVASQTVERQRVVIADDSDATAVTAVINAEPDSTDYGMVVRVVFPAQGDDGYSVTGPLAQGVVSDTPSSFVTGELQPLSLTAEGRLRVSAVQADVTRVWQGTFDDPWGFANPWQLESPYV